MVRRPYWSRIRWAVRCVLHVCSACTVLVLIVSCHALTRRLFWYEHGLHAHFQFAHASEHPAVFVRFPSFYFNAGDLTHKKQFQMGRISGARRRRTVLGRSTFSTVPRFAQTLQLSASAQDHIEAFISAAGTHLVRPLITSTLYTGEI